MAQLICCGLSVGYAGKPAASHLNFSVGAGDYLFILGENGAGKSTLLRTLLGLLPPLSGEIRWEDGLSARDIGYLPQQSAAQKDFPATAEEIVRSGCLGRARHFPFFGREEKKRAEEAMKKFGVETLADCSFRELSGGQQQRVLLSRALCAAKKVLLLDEPVSGLDPDAAADMYCLFDRMNREGMTILMISHDIRAAAAHASHILRLGGGNFFGTAREYFKISENQSGGGKGDGPCSF